MALSVLVAAVAIFCGWVFYERRPELPARFADGARGLYRAVAGKYYVPQIGSFIIYVLMVALMILFPAGLYGRRT